MSITPTPSFSIKKNIKVTNNFPIFRTQWRGNFYAARATVSNIEHARAHNFFYQEFFFSCLFFFLDYFFSCLLFFYYLWQSHHSKGLAIDCFRKRLYALDLARLSGALKLLFVAATSFITHYCCCNFYPADNVVCLRCGTSASEL